MHTTTQPTAGMPIPLREYLSRTKGALERLEERKVKHEWALMTKLMAGENLSENKRTLSGEYDWTVGVMNGRRILHMTHCKDEDDLVGASAYEEFMSFYHSAEIALENWINE